FSDKEIALLQNFAAQAVIAIENARLITETREALEQQTATAEVLGVINSSPGDLAPVFDAMLEKALTLSGAAFGVFMSYDGEHVRAVSTRGFPPELVELFARPFAPRRDGDGPYARFLRGETLLHIPDMATKDVRASLASHPRALVEIAGARTGLELPLRKDNVLLGSMWFYRQEVRPFTDKQIALLQNFAAQAVIAMENARLITETREALEQQTATAEILGVINSSPGDLAPVFEAILEKAHSLCGIAFGSLQLYEEGKVRAVAVRAVAEDLAELLREPMAPRPGSAASRLLVGERFVQNADILELAKRFPDDPRIQLSAARGLRTGLFVPLRKEADFLGFISAFRDQVRPFSDKEIALLENFAAQAVIAMENARLISETREALEQQTATSEVLQVINSSPGDLAPVFESMLDKATHVCEADFGILWVFDGELARAGALHRVPEAYAELIRAPLRPTPYSGPAQIMRGRGTFAVANMTESMGYRHGDELVRAITDLAGARSLVIAPSRKENATALGDVTMYPQTIRPVTD